MNDRADAWKKLQARVVELETLCMHFERMLSELDSVVRDQQKQLEAVRREMTAALTQWTQVAEPPEVRKPEDEKPPHY